MLNYAEIFIYEPVLTQEGTTDWRLVAHHDFTRQYLQPDSKGEMNLETLIPALLGAPPAPAPTLPPAPDLPLPPAGPDAPRPEEETHLDSRGARHSRSA